MKTVTKDKLIEILKECYTKADLCRVLDLKPTGEPPIHYKSLCNDN